MAKEKKVTGVRSAFVRVGSGANVREVVVHHGEPLPDGVTADELKRLGELGVFGPTPRHLLPVNERPRLVSVPGTAKLVPADSVDVGKIEARAVEAEEAAETLKADLAEANEKLLVAARLAPVVAQDLEKVQEHLKAHPEDREAILFLEAHGQKRKGILGETGS
ncbi:hypothetical protein [Euzebya sp.]|uniref:hypothetical protein n=1 Tax=Euzebya sp. TaxID=1971409 RepID=UPI00351792EB